MTEKQFNEQKSIEESKKVSVPEQETQDSMTDIELLEENEDNYLELVESQNKKKKKKGILKGLRYTLDSGFMGEEVFRKNLWMIILLICLSICYITNRYVSQRELIQIDDLKKELVRSKYRALSRTSELMERTLQSRILNYLQSTHDSTLRPLSVAPYKIYIEEE